ncbi:MAG: hypothetical protein M3Z14_03955, partial [Candidatus Eremiobacteraeota bacterium]|nr:hypothetical protein [Candidatus Eremiobacteraeota bacterium]
MSAGSISVTPALADHGLPAQPRAKVVYRFGLPNGKRATIFNNGVAQVVTKTGRPQVRKLYPVALSYDDVSPSSSLPDRSQILRDLTKPQTSHPFVEGRVVVVFRSGVSPSRDSAKVSAAKLRALRIQPGARIPSYTNDAGTNALLAMMGVAKTDRVFQKISRSALSAMSTNVRGPRPGQTLNLANVYRLHVTSMSVHDAVAALSKSSSVVYASPDWLVGSMRSRSIPLASDSVKTPNRMRIAATTPRLTSNGSSRMSVEPQNYALATSAQSLLNSPSTNAAAAFDEIRQRYHELPGQGEIITNVSIGDLDDASAAVNANDPCNAYVTGGGPGPTTIMMNGQRYIDWPSMPLIAAYSSDANGNVSGTEEVCGQDPQLGEVGLDFSMMAPLPHDRQRAGATGSGLTDLLGIAPGATYRLVVPRFENNLGVVDNSSTDIDAALLGAALQNPRPNVITASLGFGLDAFGFPSRYLEEDPLAEAIISSIVHNYNIAVCISSNDGTRTFTNAAIGPSGGSAPTERIAQGMNPTDLNDVSFSTAPSRVFDSGSIDVGGTTLDDIFAAAPQNPEFRRLSSQHAFAETRWTGFTDFSSGFGSRVNVSAPSDNVLSFSHPYGGAANAVDVSLGGGTSASAPEVAAAAAVALQVARLTGHPFRSASDVRDFLARTGTNVPRVP